MPKRFGPIDWGKLLGEIESLRGADKIFAGSVWGKHRSHLVLLAIEPGNEEHLDRSTAVPVALLVVRGDASHACAKSLNVHRRVGRRPHRGNAHLIFRSRGAARRSHFAVGPRLR